MKNSSALIISVLLVILAAASIFTGQWFWQTTGEATSSSKWMGPVKLYEGKTTILNIGGQNIVAISSISSSGVVLSVNNKLVSEIVAGKIASAGIAEFQITQIYYLSEQNAKNYVKFKYRKIDTSTCTDSDGNNFYAKGTATGYDAYTQSVSTKEDSCYGVASVDWACKYEYFTKSNILQLTYFDCPSGKCVNGACVAGSWCDGADIDRNGVVDSTDMEIFETDLYILAKEQNCVYDSRSNFYVVNEEPPAGMERKNCLLSCNDCDIDINKNGKVDLWDKILLNEIYGQTNCHT